MEIIPLAGHEAFIPELAELHHTEWSHLNPSLSVEMRAEAISNAAGRKGIPSIFIATSGSTLIGSAALVLQDMDTKPDLTPWLAAVYIKEHFRHQGVATKLIAQCEREALRARVDTLYLYTEYAHKFYKKLGWCSMERCEYKGVIVNVMCKKIAT